MASGNLNMDIRVDEWFRNSRLKLCMARTCRFHDEDAFDCRLKIIGIDEKGICKFFEEKR